MLRTIAKQFGGRARGVAFRTLIRAYPPFLGAGIRAEFVSDDLRRVVIRLPLTPLNRNYVGVHFGGSLFAMTDPFYMLMLIENLGPDYVVWDKQSTIRFRRPGIGTVRAVFELDEALLDRIRATAEVEERQDVPFHVEVCDEDGEIIAEIDKIVQVRKRR